MTIRSLFGLRFAALTSLTALGGCGGNTSVQNVYDCDPEVPYSTSIMLYEWGEAQSMFFDCLNMSQVAYGLCQEMAGGDQDLQDACSQTYTGNQNSCYFNYHHALNKTPLRECGAIIFKMPAFTSPHEYEGWMASEDDTDGDGISNYWEWNIGLNPCEEYSQGECSTPDSEWDYDKDGTPNGKDEGPICNPDDPLYSGECV